MPTISDQLKLHEGVRKFPYKDTAGKLTIGVGRNLEDRGLRPTEIEFLLQNDIEEATDAARRSVKNFTQLNYVRQKVIVDMIFNMGETKFREFKATIRSIEEGNFSLAAYQMKQSRWYGQVGGRSARLCAMMETGKDYD